MKHLTIVMLSLLGCQTIIGSEQQEASVRGPLQLLKPELHLLVEYALKNQDDAIEQMAAVIIQDEEINARYRERNDYKATTALYLLIQHKPYLCKVQKTAKRLEDYLKSKGAVAGFSVKIDRSKKIVSFDQAEAIDDIKKLSDALDEKLLKAGKI